MEVLALILVIFMPVAFLVWSLKFKGVLALLVIAPVLMINVFVIMWNSEFNGVDLPTLDYSHSVIMNTTSSVVLGTTTVVNHYDSVTDHYPIQYKYFTLINIMTWIFTIVMAFIVFRRVTGSRSEEVNT